MLALLCGLALLYAAHGHCSIKRQAVQVFSATADGCLAQHLGECLQRIELTRYQRWPFAVCLEYRVGIAQQMALIITPSLPARARRALNRALVLGKPEFKKLPAILTNPVL